MLVIICLFSIICFGSASSEAEHTYRISMVSSHENRGHPALFEHGESPVWDPDTQSLYFADVHQQNVHRLDYSSGQIYTKHIGYGQVNVVSLVADSRRLLVAVRSALFLLDWGVAGDAAIRLLTTLDHGRPDNVINEGKPDAQGRFWAGTKGPQTGDDVLPDKATFYSVEQASLQPRVHLRPISISNGLVFSHNNSVLYYIDSPTQKVEAFDFDLQKGELNCVVGKTIQSHYMGARRTIIDISNYGYDDAIPDGMTIDTDGHLWVALMFGGAVLHINPDTRHVVFGYKLPVSRVTSVAWGGPNLDELFVTTSRDKLNVELEPLGGAIFTIRGTGSRGVPPHAFKFENADSY